jgi:hypothetical protein
VVNNSYDDSDEKYYNYYILIFNILFLKPFSSL